PVTRARRFTPTRFRLHRRSAGRRSGSRARRPVDRASGASTSSVSLLAILRPNRSTRADHRCSRGANKKGREKTHRTKRAAAAQQTDDVTTTATAPPTPEPIQKPAEEAAAVALRDALGKFNEGANARSALTTEDNAALDEIEALAAAYNEAALVAWEHNCAPWYSNLKWGPTTPPAIVTTLPDAVNPYIADCRGDNPLPFRDGRTKWVPYIRNVDNRQEIANNGRAITGKIAAAIGAGYARIAAAHEAQRALRDRVRRWLAFPLVRQLVDALITTVDSRPELITGRTRTLTALRAELQSVALAEERAGRKVPEQIWTHEWRGWLPFAREILNEDGHNNEAPTGELHHE